jgi:peptide/nickel transport system substrate-binding protein
LNQRLGSVLAAALVGLSACERTGSGSGPAGGTISISASADADALLPPLTMSVQGKQIGDQIFDNLADIGPNLSTVGDIGFTPRLAKSWRWARDSMSIDFTIDPGARWHDGVAVSAGDVKATFALVKDPKVGSPLSSNLDNVDSVSIQDSMTARVWLHRRAPDSFWKVASSVAILPAHVLRPIPPEKLRESSFAQHPIGSGRFRFSTWERGSRIVLTADSSNYRKRPNADRAVWLISADYGAAAVRFLSGAADFLDVVKPEYVSQVQRNGEQLITTNGSLDYGYLAFNLGDGTRGQVHPILGDREVRRALVMAVDRNALVRSVFDTLGLVGHGPVTRALPTSDTTIGLPYDSARAAHTLDSLGWKRGADGIRARAGKHLAFSLMTPSSSAIRSKLAVLLQAQWRRAGADVRIESIEANAFGARMEDRQFDAALNAWHIDPTPSSVREEWASSEIKKGGYNETSYRNPTFDAVIDSALVEANPSRSVALYRRAYRILTDDAPAMWIYELRNVHGVSRRIRTVGIRADGWWSGLSNWSVVGPSLGRTR